MNTPRSTPHHTPAPHTDPTRTPSTGAPGARTSAAAATHNARLGARGEAIALRYLTELGFTLVARNWRCRYGELDLVMREGDTAVAVEVKTRSGIGFGTPLEAVTMRKAARLRRLLFEWTHTAAFHPQSLRVDAVGITILPGAPSPEISHIRAIA